MEYKMCRRACSLSECPFAQTAISDEIQNYGCLPTPVEILALKQYRGLTWACHSDNSKPCMGAIKAFKRLGIPEDSVKLVTEKTLTSDLMKFSEKQLKDSYALLYSKRV